MCDIGAVVVSFVPVNPIQWILMFSNADSSMNSKYCSYAKPRYLLCSLVLLYSTSIAVHSTNNPAHSILSCFDRWLFIIQILNFDE